jgi:membrane fusion protein
VVEKSLFRREVLDAKQGESMGTILIAAPLSRWLLSGFAVALAIALLTFLFFGHYTRRESVAGQLVPSAGLLNVLAPSAGTVKELNVSDGQSVKEGDVLLELSSEQDSAKLGNAHAAISEQLEAQRGRLTEDLKNQASLAQQQAESLRAKLVLLRSQQAQIDGQIELQLKQVSSNEELLERIKPLGAKGYVSVFQIKQQESALLDAQTQHRVLVRQQLDTRQQIEAAQQQLTQLPLDESSKRNDTERQIANVAQSLAQNEMQRAVVLRAPRDGMVATVLLKQGQMASAGQPLLSILPVGSELQAQLLVPSRAVGFIEPGNTVVLRYQAFPYQKFGQQFGRVTDISRSALSPADVNALVGQQVKEPLYKVMVTLESQQVMAYGRPEPVKPGMALDADIMMDRRSLIEWVFEPLYGIGHHLMGGQAHG